jgi:hypothetical protein
MVSSWLLESFVASGVPTEDSGNLQFPKDNKHSIKVAYRLLGEIISISTFIRMPPPTKE